MKDFIPKGTGNSRWMKSSIPTGTTWEEALAMLRAGTFPFDLNGINSAGVAQMGMAMNTANLFSGETEAKYPDGVDTPNKAFDSLAPLLGILHFEKIVDYKLNAETSDFSITLQESFSNFGLLLLRATGMSAVSTSSNASVIVQIKNTASSSASGCRLGEYRASLYKPTTFIPSAWLGITVVADDVTSTESTTIYTSSGGVAKEEGHFAAESSPVLYFDTSAKLRAGGHIEMWAVRK